MRGDIITVVAIALWAGTLSSAAADEDQIKYATGTLDYENVGKHDCEPGYEVPVRFVAENVELSVSFPGRSKWVKERRGTTIERFEVPGDDSVSFPDSGFFLNLDITLCIAPFITTVAAGSWKIWHESGQETFIINGALPSDKPDLDEFQLFSAGYLETALDRSKGGFHDERNYKYGFYVIVRELDFKGLQDLKKDVPQWGMPHAGVAITTELAHLPEGATND